MKLKNENKNSILLVKYCFIFRIIYNTSTKTDVKGLNFSLNCKVGIQLKVHTFSYILIASLLMSLVETPYGLLYILFYFIKLPLLAEVYISFCILKIFHVQNKQY